MWLCRAFVIGLVRIAARSGIVLCPNFFLAENALALPDQTLYTAREVAQMIPLYGLKIYHRIRQANGWVQEYLPNASGPPAVEIPTSSLRTPLKPLLEIVFNSPLGTALEQWEMNRKIRKFTAQARTVSELVGETLAETRFSPERCQGHFDGYGKRTMAAFQARVEAVIPT